MHQGPWDLALVMPGAVVRCRPKPVAFVRTIPVAVIKQKVNSNPWDQVYIRSRYCDNFRWTRNCIRWWGPYVDIEANLGIARSWSHKLTQAHQYY
jgi:hypothetical protein